MIKKVEALYYKGFKYIDVDLLPYNILVGPNASGKSSLLDVFTFIKDVLNDGPSNAVEKRSSRFTELVWNNERNYFEFALEFDIPIEMHSTFQFARYEISLRHKEDEGIIIDNENLWLIKKSNGKQSLKKTDKQLSLFPAEPDAPEHIAKQRTKSPTGWRKIVSKSSKGNDVFRSENTEWNIVYRFGPKKASLARIPEDVNRFPVSLWIKNILMEGIQFIQLDSNSMRWPCRPDASVSFETDGSNIAKVVKNLKVNYPNIFSRWLEHVRTALPDIKEIKINEKLEDRFLYLIIEYQNGIVVPSWLLSDGTLRLLAQTLIAYLPVKDKIFIIEEPENGLHPQAIETVIQSLSSTYDNQIILATHSPIVLRLSKPKDILCFSKTETGAIDVIRGDQHPKLKEWKKDVDLSTLHAAGVLQ